MCYLCNIQKCGNSSVGRAQPCQGWGREFKSRLPLIFTFAQAAAARLVRRENFFSAGQRGRCWQLWLAAAMVELVDTRDLKSLGQ